MKFDSDKCHRRSIRLKGWDYASPGYYFITICTQGRECRFGEILNGKMMLNNAGKMAEKYWLDIPIHYPHAELDEFIIMPNHVHGISGIKDFVGAYDHTPQRPNRSVPKEANIYSPLRTASDEPLMKSPSKTVGSIVRGFKIGVSLWFRKNTEMLSVWQRNYYEHIIRSEAELDQTRQYIRNNPVEWLQDVDYPGKKNP